MQTWIPDHFIPSSRAEILQRLQRGLYPVALTLAGSLIVNALLQGAGDTAPTQTLVRSSVNDGQGYVLPSRYSGLTSHDDIESATVTLARSAYERVPPYHFDLFNRLAFEGENMFDVDEGRITPDLRADFESVRTAFCQRHEAYHPLTPQSRFVAVCRAEP